MASRASGAAVVGIIGVAGFILVAGQALGDFFEDDSWDRAEVVRVVDGDTVDVLIDDEETRVRLLNIDTPETKDPNEPVQCLGPEATDFLTDRLPPGTPVELVYDEERTDRYDRVLAGVFESDSLVNAEIAAAGLGVPALFEPNDLFYDDVLEASENAEDEALGLFSPEIGCTPSAIAQSALAEAEAVPTDVTGNPAVALETAAEAAASLSDVIELIDARGLALGDPIVMTSEVMVDHLSDLRDELELVRTSVFADVDTLSESLDSYKTEQRRLEEENVRQREEEEAQKKAAEEREREERSEASTDEQEDRRDSGDSSGAQDNPERAPSEPSDAAPSPEPTDPSGGGSSSPDPAPETTAPPAEESEDSESSGGCVPYGPEIPYSDDGGYTGQRYGMPGGETFRKCA